MLEYTLSTVSGRFLERIQKSTFTLQMLEYTLSTVPGRFLKRIQKSTFTLQMVEYTLSTVSGRFLKRIQKSTFTLQMVEYTLSTVPGRFLKRIQKSTFTFQMLEYTCQLYQEGSWKEYRNQHSPSKCWSIPVNCTRKVPGKNTEINIHLPNVGVYLSTVPGRFLKRIQKSTFTFQMLEYTCQLYQEGS